MQYDVAIIGAGFGGLAMGIKLRMAGQKSFVILERAEELGGTWRENVYPGCACDIPANLYSFSFAPKADWSRKYAGQEEILDYLKETSKSYEMERFIKYNADVRTLSFDESKHVWNIETAQGDRYSAKVVVSATGPLNRPNLLNLPGEDSFEGKIFHTAHWDKNFDPTGKKVVVIGTGASAIQAIPELAKKAKKLYVLQRSAPWIIPRPDRKFLGLEKWLNTYVPGLLWLRRTLLYWQLELRVGSFTGNAFLNRLATKEANKFREKSIKDPKLRAATTPNYTIGCKRVLVSSDYYPALQQDNVELIQSSAVEVKPRSLVDAEGRAWEADAILLATGFVASEIYMNMKIYGRKGQELLQSWEAEGPEAYYGMSISGYPNLFFLLGPNTGLGHNSVVHIIESQVNYILDYLKVLQENQLAYMDVKKEKQEAFNAEIQEKLSQTVWQNGGCSSWYQTSKGKNTTLWPGSTVKYRKETKKVHVEAYDREKVPAEKITEEMPG